MSEKEVVAVTESKGEEEGDGEEPESLTPAVTTVPSLARWGQP